jgi:hypothetical protein
MTISTFHHRFKTVSDNTKFWKIVDYLRSTGKKVKVDMPNVFSGNSCSFECYPYPHPDELAIIKPLIHELDRAVKEASK